LSHNPVLAGLKHLNRLEQVLAASEWCREWAQEGLMLDVAGSVIEGTISNIFVVSNDILRTPRLNYCGVAGVMRSAILKKFADDLHLHTREERMGIADVLAADAVFVCNSIFGVWPVKSIGVSVLKREQSITDGLWQSLNALGYSRLYG
jgi:4-amino-4-deoxychorismate lyase